MSDAAKVIPDGGLTRGRSERFDDAAKAASAKKKKAKKAGLLQKIRGINLFPEYVEHGDNKIVLRGIVKTVIFVVLLLSTGLKILLDKLSEDLPSLRINKEADARLLKPTFDDYKAVNGMVETKGWGPLICPCAVTQVKTIKMFEDGMAKSKKVAARRRLREAAAAAAGAGAGASAGAGARQEWPAPGATDAQPDDSVGGQPPESQQRGRGLAADTDMLAGVSFYTMIDQCQPGQQQLSFAMLKKFPITYHNRTGGLRDHTLVNPAMGADYGTAAGMAFLRHFKARGSAAEAWSAADFITEDDFRAEMVGNHNAYFEIRNISIAGLCAAARNLIEKNKNAYLARFLSSPSLMDQRTIRSVLDSRFIHMKDLSLSTFNIAFEQDTFRMDFEGLVSTWGKQVNRYVDSLHSQNTGAMLDAYESMFNYAVGATFRNMQDVGVGAEIWDVDFCVRMIEGLQLGTMWNGVALTAAGKEAELRACQNNVLPQYGFHMPTDVPVNTKLVKASTAPPDPTRLADAEKYVLAADGNDFKAGLPIVRPAIGFAANFKQASYGRCWSPPPTAMPKQSDFMCSGPGGITHDCLNYAKAQCTTPCTWGPPVHMRPTNKAYNVWEFENRGAVEAAPVAPAAASPYFTPVDCCSSFGNYVTNQCSRRCWGADPDCKDKNFVACQALKHADGTSKCKYGGVGANIAPSYSGGKTCSKCNKLTGKDTLCLGNSVAYTAVGSPYFGKEQTCTADQLKWLAHRESFESCCPHHPHTNYMTMYTPALHTHDSAKPIPDAWWTGTADTLSRTCAASPHGNQFNCGDKMNNVLEAFDFKRVGWTGAPRRGLGEFPGWQTLAKHWWNGALPKKNVVSNPTGGQLSAFARSVMKYQAYCARHNLPSMPLYDTDKPRVPSECQPASHRPARGPLGRQPRRHLQKADTAPSRNPPPLYLAQSRPAPAPSRRGRTPRRR